MSFAEFWLRFPRKVAKKAAEKAYDKAVKQYPHSAIMASLEIMLQTEWRGRGTDYLPHAATFLNRETFEVEERCELLEDDAPEPWETCLAHKHWCNGRGQHRGHEWLCDDKLCFRPGHAGCEALKVISLVDVNEAIR